MPDYVEIAADNHWFACLLLETIYIGLKGSIPSFHSVLKSFEIAHTRVRRVDTNENEVRENLGDDSTLNIQVNVVWICLAVYDAFNYT